MEPYPIEEESDGLPLAVDRLRLALPRQDQADPLHMLHDWWDFFIDSKNEYVILWFLYNGFRAFILVLRLFLG
jgi:hypothetical protein